MATSLGIDHECKAYSTGVRVVDAQEATRIELETQKSEYGPEDDSDHAHCYVK